MLFEKYFMFFHKAFMKLLFDFNVCRRVNKPGSFQILTMKMSENECFCNPLLQAGNSDSQYKLYSMLYSISAIKQTICSFDKHYEA